MITLDSDEVGQRAATGSLPGFEEVDTLVIEAHRRYAGRSEGTVASYIPELSKANPDHFGLALAEVGGAVHDAGDAQVPFSIQSISKLFVAALAVKARGHAMVREVVGVNNTGMAFNSVVALELNDGHPLNPMVNAGAIATTALLTDAGPDAAWDLIRGGLSAFAGRDLAVDRDVYVSEAASNDRNMALGRLLRSYGRVNGDVDAMVDVYTRQCSLSVTAHDLAVMGATLADGGVNPVTGRRVVEPETARDCLAIAAASGLYERSGEWLFEIGLPAKSGVAGGIVAIAPGKAGVGSYSPPLDSAGNSVRSQLAMGFLSRSLGLNLFASSPAANHAESPAEDPHTP